MKCSRCGAQLEDDAAFCSKCGSVINASVASRNSRAINEQTRLEDMRRVSAAAYYYEGIQDKVNLRSSISAKVIRDQRKSGVALLVFSIILFVFAAFYFGVALLAGGMLYSEEIVTTGEAVSSRVGGAISSYTGVDLNEGVELPPLISAVFNDFYHSFDSIREINNRYDNGGDENDLAGDNESIDNISNPKDPEAEESKPMAALMLAGVTLVPAIIMGGLAIIFLTIYFSTNAKRRKRYMENKELKARLDKEISTYLSNFNKETGYEWNDSWDPDYINALFEILYTERAYSLSEAKKVYDQDESYREMREIQEQALKVAEDARDYAKWAYYRYY